MNDSMAPKGVHNHLATLAVASSRVIIGGEPGSGRAALLTTLAAAVPAHERIIQIVVGDEIRLDQANVVSLRERTQYSVARAVDDVRRMVGNRLIMGEIGDGNAARALAMSRCPTLTTLRAASPGDAGDRMAHMLRCGTETSIDSVLRLLNEEGTVYVQMGHPHRRALDGIYQLVEFDQADVVDPVTHSLRLANSTYGFRRLWTVEDPGSPVRALRCH